MRIPLADKLKTFLSDQRVTRAILAISLAGRAIQLLFFYNIRFDGSYQYIATRNFLEGHGFSLARVAGSDLSQIIYEPLINWPPGYSLLLAPFYALFNQDYIAAGLTLDLLAALLLIWVCRRILHLFGTPVYQVNLFTLLTSFFIYYFYLIASSDSVTIPLFLLALYYTLSLCKEGKHPVKKTIGITVSLFLCASTKYLFLPIVFILPVLLLVKGIADKDRRLKNAGLLSILVLGAALGGLLAWQKIQSGSATYISQPGRGFFPEHILAAYPFVPASFIKPDTPGLLLRLPAETGSSLYRLYQVVHLLLLAAGLWMAYKIISRYGFKKLPLTVFYFYVSFAVLLTITGLLATLSLMVPKETINPGWRWTYIEEPRYYGLLNVLLHLGVFIFYRHHQPGPSRFARNTFYFLLLLMLPEMIRGMVFDARRILAFRQEEYSWQYELRFQRYADALLQKEKTNLGTEQLAVTGSSHYMNNRVSLYNGIPVLNEARLVNDTASLQSKTPVLLLVMIHEKDFPNFKPFTSGRQPKGQFEGYAFYTVYVKPH